MLLFQTKPIISDKAGPSKMKEAPSDSIGAEAADADGPPSFAACRYLPYPPQPADWVTFRRPADGGPSAAGASQRCALVRARPTPAVGTGASRARPRAAVLAPSACAGAHARIGAGGADSTLHQEGSPSAPADSAPMVR